MRTFSELPMAANKLANYNSVRGADAYKADYRRKLHRKVSDRIERRILRRFFGELGRCATILDLPCGAGRLFSLLQEYSGRVLEADWSYTMLDLNRRDHCGCAHAYLRCSALRIPLQECAVDTVVSVRLSHHLVRPADRELHCRELFRVARRGVVVTWFSATSLKNLLRRVRAPLNRKRPKNTMHTGRVIEIATDCGFEKVACLPLSRLGSGHVFGLFKRGEKDAASVGRVDEVREREFSRSVFV